MCVVTYFKLTSDIDDSKEALKTPDMKYDPMRTYKILHYLDQNRRNPKLCKMTRLHNILVTTPYKLSKAQVRFMIREGWVEELDDPPKCFKITEKGRKFLKTLHDALYPHTKRIIDEFKKRD